MVIKSTATKLKDLTNYAGEVGLFELSKMIKKGNLSFKHIIVARFKPASGVKNTTVWLSNSSGAVSFVEPFKELHSDNISDALKQLGYKYL